MKVSITALCIAQPDAGGTPSPFWIRPGYDLAFDRIGNLTAIRRFGGDEVPGAPVHDESWNRDPSFAGESPWEARAGFNLTAVSSIA